MRQILPLPGRGQLGPADPIGAAGPVRRKTGAARDLIAALAEIYAYPREPVSDAPTASDRRSPDGGQWIGRQWIRANMIASVDGAVTVSGRSAGLSGPADRLVFTVLRSLADVIVVGAETARAERYRQAQPAELWQQLRAGRPPAPPIAVITRRIDLDVYGRLFGQPATTHEAITSRTIVITTEQAPADRLRAAAQVADVIVAGDSAVDMHAAIKALHQRGHGKMLVEGGPALLGQLTAEGLLDELCLTISPLLEGGYSAARLTRSPRASARARAGEMPVTLTGLRLASVLEDEGFLLNRYTRA